MVDRRPVMFVADRQHLEREKKNADRSFVKLNSSLMQSAELQTFTECVQVFLASVLRFIEFHTHTHIY